jgi:hypothetical protein
MDSPFKVDPDELNDALPKEVPDATYWPFYLAMGIAFAAWGLLTMWLISLTGLIIIIISLVGWINILRHEPANDED